MAGIRKSDATKGTELEVDARHARLSVSYRWRSPLSPYAAPLLLALAAATCLAELFYARPAPRGLTAGSVFDWCLVVAPTYYILAHTLNRSTIEVTRDHLSVRHGPLPWRRGKSVRVSEVSHFYCGETISKHKGAYSYRYSVEARLKCGGAVRLLGGFGETGTPHAMHERVGMWLGLPGRCEPFTRVGPPFGRRVDLPPTASRGAAPDNGPHPTRDTAAFKFLNLAGG